MPIKMFPNVYTTASPHPANNLATKTTLAMAQAIHQKQLMMDH